jgi:hypothetical protein
MYVYEGLGSGISYLPFAIIRLFVLSESNSILPRAWADIEVFLMLGVLSCGKMGEGCVA